MITLVSSLSIRQVEVDKALGDNVIAQSTSVRQVEVDKALGDNVIAQSTSVRQIEMDRSKEGVVVDSLSLSPHGYGICEDKEEPDKLSFKTNVTRTK